MLVSSLTIAACGSDGESGSAGDLTVFAAASLTEAFTEIGDAFMAANPDVTVSLSFAASSELVTQIGQGAPADVFASADLANMTKLTDAGLVGTEVADGPVVFARNLSEIIVEPGNPLGIAGVADLADPEVVLVTCAPEVPCGSYAAQIFAKAGVEVTPDSFEENVKGVVTKVTLGEADAGIAYATDVLAAGDQAAGVRIRAELNVVAEYPIALVADAGNAVTGRAFVDFVMGADGQRILADYGFTSP